MSTVKMNPTNIPQVSRTLSNGDFLRAISGPLALGERYHLAGFPESPDTPDARWGGYSWADETGDCPADPSDNNYFSVAVLNGPQRRRSNFVRMMALVADDPLVLPEGPTWALHTSAGKRQVGYALADDEASRNAELCALAVKAMAERGLCGVDKSGNNAVRYVRLLKGTNTKYQPPFEHQLLTWEPTRRYTLAEALAAFGIDIATLLMPDPAPETRAGEIDDATIIGTLMKVDPACSYDEWTKACMAVHHATKGSIRGLKAFDYWSMTAGPAKYAGAQVIKAKWASLGEYTGAPVTWASLEHLAREQSTIESPFDDLTATHAALPTVEPVEVTEIAPDPELVKGWAEAVYSLTELDPTEYLIEGFIAHSLMILAGQPGVGKTTAMAALMLLVAGFELPGCTMSTPKRRKVIYVGEDLGQMRDILYAYAKTFGLKAIPEWIVLVEAHRAELDEFRQLTHNVRRHRYDGEWPWLVIDTAAATLALESENDNSEVSAYIGDIKAKFFAKGVPVAFTTHLNKTVTKDTVDATARGASAFTGDATLTATLFEEEGEHYMRLGKRRYAPEITQIRLDTRRHTEVVMTRHGDLQTKTVVYVVPVVTTDEERAMVKEETRESREAERRAQREMEALGQAEAIAQYVHELEAMHGPVIMRAGGRGGSHVPTGGLTGYILTWDQIWELGPVRRPNNERAIREAVMGLFEPLNGWGRLVRRAEGALWD